MGLIVSVYRSPLGDCTNSGFSSRARCPRDQLCLVNVEGPFHPDKDTPAAMLVDHRPFGDEVGRRLVRIVAAAELESGEYAVAEPDRWSMFGGNYAACSDSRLREAIEERLGVFFYGAVPIHDRYE